MNKLELASILNDHSIAVLNGTVKPYTAADITDEMVKLYNSEYARLINKWPNVDFSVDDYEGEPTDDYIEMLSNVAKKGGIEILEAYDAKEMDKKYGEAIDVLLRGIGDESTNPNYDMDFSSLVNVWDDNNLSDATPAVIKSTLEKWIKDNGLDRILPDFRAKFPNVDENYVDDKSSSGINFHPPIFNGPDAPASLMEIDDDFIDFYDPRFNTEEDVIASIVDNGDTWGYNPDDIQVVENVYEDRLYRWLVKPTGGPASRTNLINMFESMGIRTGRKPVSRLKHNKISKVRAGSKVNKIFLAESIAELTGADILSIDASGIVMGSLDEVPHNMGVVSVTDVYEVSDSGITYFKHLPVSKQAEVIDHIMSMIDNAGGVASEDDLSVIYSMELENAGGSLVVRDYKGSDRLASISGLSVNDIEDIIASSLSLVRLNEGYTNRFSPLDIDGVVYKIIESILNGDTSGALKRALKNVDMLELEKYVNDNIMVVYDDTTTGFKLEGLGDMLDDMGITANIDTRTAEWRVSNYFDTEYGDMLSRAIFNESYRVNENLDDEMYDRVVDAVYYGIPEVNQKFNNKYQLYRQYIASYIDDFVKVSGNPGSYTVSGFEFFDDPDVRESTGIYVDSDDANRLVTSYLNTGA